MVRNSSWQRRKCRSKCGQPGHNHDHSEDIISEDSEDSEEEVVEEDSEEEVVEEDSEEEVVEEDSEEEVVEEVVEEDSEEEIPE